MSDVIRCRHCGREITDKVNALSPMALPGGWVHWGVDGFPWRGCRAASKTDVMPYWDDSLDRRWVAEPEKSR